MSNVGALTSPGLLQRDRNIWFYSTNSSGQVESESPQTPIRIVVFVNAMALATGVQLPEMTQTYICHVVCVTRVGGQGSRNNPLRSGRERRFQPHSHRYRLRDGYLSLVIRIDCYGPHNRTVHYLLKFNVTRLLIDLFLL